MTPDEIMIKIEEIVNQSKTAVLATIDQEGRPTMRWMTPACIKGRPNALFTVSSPSFQKIKQLEVKPEVEWMIQSTTLKEIINLRGRANIIDNPSLKAEVMENLGKRLKTFWTVNDDEIAGFVVVETIIEHASYFLPLSGKKSEVEF